ncbi:MAG: hypothetical protein IPN63_07900 [Gammaproteobacteria bacterium]|nr:hypothetical protein [Gammaproteobacteria bacterium]
MTVKLLLVKSENGLETRQDYDGLSSANPAFTGALTGGSAALTGDVDAGGEIKSDALVGTGARPLVALADGTIDDQDAAMFRGTIGAESAIPDGTDLQYLDGWKAWRDFATSVRSVVLTGLSAASSTAVAATDTVLQAIGKLQAQVSLRLTTSNPNFTGNLLQDGDQRITPSGGGRFTDLSLTTLAAGSDLPVASDAAGVIRNKTAGEFRTIIGAAASAGVTDGSDAASGVVGQYYEAFLPEASMVYAVNGSPVAVLSLSLPAGDWLVEGRATAHITGAMNGNKVVSGLNTSIAIPTDGTEVYGGLQVFSATNGFQTMTGSKRFSLTATTTVYLVARIDFGAGTPALFGCMSARRMR